MPWYRVTGYGGGSAFPLYYNAGAGCLFRRSGGERARYNGLLTHCVCASVHRAPVMQTRAMRFGTGDE
jgi:hypothetical protein